MQNKINAKTKLLVLKVKTLCGEAWCWQYHAMGMLLFSLGSNAPPELMGEKDGAKYGTVLEEKPIKGFKSLDSGAQIFLLIQRH